MSDPQERAWYDDHRDAILRYLVAYYCDQSSGGKATDADPEEYINFIYPYFTSTCYNAYNDAADGFYTVYDRLFKEIIKKEKYEKSSRRRVRL